jgi:hypothetical protein
MRRCSTTSMLVAGLALSVLAGCDAVPANPADARVDVDAIPDATPGPDARTLCDPTAPFTSIEPLRGMPAGNWYTARLSRDERTLYTAGGALDATQGDLFDATRGGLDDPFGDLAPLPTSSPTGTDSFPSVSDDGELLVFDSQRENGRRLYIADRDNTLADFGTAAPIGRVAGPGAGDSDTDPFLTADDAELWFASNRTGSMGNLDIYVARRDGLSFATPDPVLALNSTESDGLPTLSADRLTIYFQSTRSDTSAAGGYDIWTSTRSTLDDGFPRPRPVTELNTAGTDWPGWLSADKCRLYYSSERPAGQTLFIATRTP